MAEGWEVGDSTLIEVISDHIERTIGPIDLVWHEIVSDDLHIDLHHVPPGPDRPYHCFVTSGMAARPMTVPREAADFAYAELLALLPTDWPVSKPAFEDDNNFWPLRVLKLLARYPHKHRTWLGYGHTINNESDPPIPFAPSTELCGTILLPSVTLPEASWTLERDGHAAIHFWTLFPLYADEIAFKREHGTDALLEVLDEANVEDIIHPTRPSALSGWKP